LPPFALLMPLCSKILKAGAREEPYKVNEVDESKRGLEARGRSCMGIWVMRVVAKGICRRHVDNKLLMTVYVTETARVSYQVNSACST
jgi:hypothetical protein